MVIEILAQFGVHLHQEIVLADGYPVEFGVRVEEAFHLRVELRLVFIALLPFK